MVQRILLWTRPLQANDHDQDTPDSYEDWYRTSLNGAVHVSRAIDDRCFRDSRTIGCYSLLCRNHSRAELASQPSSLSTLWSSVVPAKLVFRVVRFLAALCVLSRLRPSLQSGQRWFVFRVVIASMYRVYSWLTSCVALMLALDSWLTSCVSLMLALVLYVSSRLRWTLSCTCGYLRRESMWTCTRDQLRAKYENEQLEFNIRCVDIFMPYLLK